jgi:hypothetical protein
MIKNSMLYASILATFTRHDSSALLMLFCSAGNGERGQWFLHAQLILQSATACAARRQLTVSLLIKTAAI